MMDDELERELDRWLNELVDGFDLPARTAPPLSVLELAWSVDSPVLPLLGAAIAKAGGFRAIRPHGP